MLGSDSRLAALLNKGYDYKLMLPPAGGLVGSAAAAAAGNDGLQTFASSTADFTADPVQVTVDMPDGQVRRQAGSVVLGRGGRIWLGRFVQRDSSCAPCGGREAWQRDSMEMENYHACGAGRERMGSAIAPIATSDVRGDKQREDRMQAPALDLQQGVGESL